MGEVLVAMRALTRTRRQECIPAPLAVSVMVGLRDPIPSGDSRVLAASMEEASLAVASMAEAGTAAEATDSSLRGDEDMKRETTKLTNRFNVSVQRFSGCVRSAMVPFAILAMWAINGANPGLAQQSAQPTFPSATQASQTLFEAVQSNNEAAIATILGGQSELTSSRDPGQDKLDREMFAQKYQEMHRLGREPDGSMTLYIGAENWPFPIPLVSKNGSWRFDPDAGAKEVTFRRIGDDEFMAIATCHEFVAAKRRYRTDPNAADAADISAASLVAKAASGANGGDPVLLHGYYFRVFSTRAAGGQRTGPFALIAYPAEYRSSGVMSFVITDNDVVYEKDLGADTSALAKSMTAFHKDGSWRVAD
jgi:hypothetical protein